MKKLIPFLIAIILIGVVIAVNYKDEIKHLGKRAVYSYGVERADLNEYFKIYSDSEVPIVLQDTLIEEKAELIDGNYYLDNEVVRTYLTVRFYHDKNEGLLLYSNGRETIRAEIGSDTYLEGGETRKASCPVAIVKNDTLLISMDYLKHFVNFSYEVFDSPKHMQVYTEWGEKKVADIKGETQVRKLAGIKSLILKDVKSGESVEILDVIDDWTKIKTQDAYIGYVESIYLTNERDETELPVKDVAEEEMPSLTHDYKINMTWHYMEAPQGGPELKTLLANTKSLNVIAPTWYMLTDSEGNFKSLANKDYVTTAHKMGLEVWACVKDDKKEADMVEIITHTSKRTVLINNLIEETLKYGADGINLDFEQRVDYAYGESFIQFVRELAIACHDNNLVVSVDNFIPSEYTAHYGRAEQGKFIDYFVIMNYDEHYAGSDAGSVSSIDWMTKAIENTCLLVPSNKVINGVPFYTRVWKTKDNKTTSEAVTMEVAQQFIKKNKIQTELDPATGQNYGEKTMSGTLYQVWLEDATSMNTRLNVMQNNNLAGIASWIVGQETANIWDLIAAYMQQ